MSHESMFDRAMRYRVMGLSVIPIPAPRRGVEPGRPGDGKVPAIAWREFQTRLPTHEEIAAWFADEPVNMAIVCGSVSGVVAVDCDSPEAARAAVKRLPYTDRQTKTSRGYHLFYRCGETPVRNRARVWTTDGRMALDVRGEGGYVIAPGSIHATGATYEEAGDWSVPTSALPLFWPGWMERPRETKAAARTSSGVRPIGLRVERARRYLAAIPLPEIGQGSDSATLYAACRLVRGFMLSDSEAEDLLWEWCGGRSGWSRDWVAEKVEHAKRYGSEPQGRYA